MITEWASCAAPIIRLPLWQEAEAVLMEAWHVEVRGFEFTVPAGARTDGASIPRMLWRVCGHPLETPRVYAATLHDWLYGGGAGGITRKEADECYYALLRHFGVAGWRAKIEYWALRMFGAGHYGARSAPDKTEGEEK